MTIEIKGTMEIDQQRGVIYIHDEYGRTVLRICSLPKPIPNPKYNLEKPSVVPDGLDITHMHGCSW